ncbi:MAG: hypothetical protein KF878_01755 [Planctomycetes bacterium]|nr:hypothetical protein [Planctomycetota bacterium]
MSARDGLPRALAVTAALAALPWALGAAPLVRFTRERIELHARPGALTVDGRYVYENPWPLPLVQGLDVPFAQGDGQAAPATVAAFVVDAGGAETPLPVRWVLGRPRVSVTVPARGAVELRVRFEQVCAAGRGTYLLTTTRPWGRPLVEAEYLVRTDRVRLVRSSLPLDAGDRTVRRDFLPEDDWRLEWSP